VHVATKSIVMVAVLVVAILGSGLAGAWFENSHTGNDTASQKRVVTSESRLISQIAKTVGPSVVSVNVDVSNSFQAAGTGIIVSTSGLIVTNRHVVPTGTDNVSVTLSDGTELKDVSVVGRTSESDTLDVAFLKINDAKGHHLKAAIIGNSSQAQVGDNVVAIGNALGEFQNTVTSGIISGFGRSLQAGDSSGNSATEDLVDLFQTDAAINEGNSGGPLVNLNGEVIGINTAVAGDGAQNIGFAIPIDNVRGLINQVVKTGKFSRPYLGVRYIPLTPDVADQLSLSVSSGAYIPPSDDQFNSSVLPDGPAAKAGLQEKDVITAVNDKKIDQSHSLSSLLGVYQPGTKVRLTVLRGDKTLHFDLKLGELPQSS
jgi:serine protease Do